MYLQNLRQPVEMRKQELEPGKRELLYEALQFLGWVGRDSSPALADIAVDVVVVVGIVAGRMEIMVQGDDVALGVAVVVAVERTPAVAANIAAAECSAAEQIVAAAVAAEPIDMATIVDVADSVVPIGLVARSYADMD